MNRLSAEDRTRVIACLVEGNSQRATVRMTGIAKKTVGRLAVEIGEACERFADNVSYMPSNCRWATAKEQRANQSVCTT